MVAYKMVYCLGEAGAGEGSVNQIANISQEIPFLHECVQVLTEKAAELGAVHLISFIMHEHLVISSNFYVPILKTERMLK
jgi:hypothetical protein